MKRFHLKYKKSKGNNLDRIYRMDRIFFAFPEERQKVLFLPEKQYEPGYHIISPGLFLPHKRDCPSTFSYM